MESPIDEETVAAGAGIILAFPLWGQWNVKQMSLTHRFPDSATPEELAASFNHNFRTRTSSRPSKKGGSVIRLETALLYTATINWPHQRQQQPSVLPLPSNYAGRGQAVVPLLPGRGSIRVALERQIQ